MDLGLDLNCGPSVSKAITLTFVTRLWTVKLTAYVQSFALLAFADGVVDFALDDGVVVLPGDVVQDELGGVVAYQWLVVEEPSIGDVGRIGVRLTAQTDVSTFRDASVASYAGEDCHRHFWCVLHLKN